MSDQQAQSNTNESAIPAGQRRLYELIDSSLMEFGSLEPRQKAIMALAKELHVDKPQLRVLVDHARANHPQINAVARVHKLIENAKASGKKPDLSMFRRLQPAAKSAGKDDLWLGQQLGYIPQFLEDAAKEQLEGKKKSNVLPIMLSTLLVLGGVGGFVWWQTYGDMMSQEKARIAVDDSAWEEALVETDLAGFQGYLRNHPGGLHVQQAEGKIAELAELSWLAAQTLNTRYAYQAHIEDFSAHNDETLALMDGYLTGDTFRDCVGCPEMIVLPLGKFEMGSDEGDRDELPIHEVSITQPIAVGIFEVTFAEWDLCVLKSGCATDIYDSDFGRGLRPVINISWDEAQEYLAWLSSESRATYRLLSESEWEYATRAGSSGGYWWGAGFSMNKAVCTGCESDWTTESSAEVGKFSGNTFGLFDAAGNAAEWVADCRHEDYSGAPTDSSVWLADAAGDCNQAVVRGGSWVGNPLELRSADRTYAAKSYRDTSIGFRVARDIK